MDCDLIIATTVEHARGIIAEGVDLVISDRNLGDHNIPQGTSGVDVIASALDAGMSPDDVAGFSTNVRDYTAEIGNSGIRVIEKVANTKELVLWVSDRIKALNDLRDETSGSGMRLVSTERGEDGITVWVWEILPDEDAIELPA